MVLVISASDPTPNLETQFRSILEEYIETTLDKQETKNGVVNHLLKIDNNERVELINNRVVNYFLKIDDKVMKFINNGAASYLLEIDNPKPLEFINHIFDIR